MMFSYQTAIQYILFATGSLVLAAPSTEIHRVTIYHVGQSSTAFVPLAKLSFNVSQPEVNKIESFTSPTASKSQSRDEVASIGVILSNPIPKSLSSSDPTLQYRTTLTSLASLQPPYRGRFTITVTEEGAVRSASWSAIPKSADFAGQGDFDTEIIREGPRPIIEVAPPSKGGRAGASQSQGERAGDEEEEPEKTFLQKYWWAILGALMLIMVTGGDDK